MISLKEVSHIAKLARIKFDKQDLQKMQKDLSLILEYVEKLKEVDVEKIKPTFHSVQKVNEFRKDEPEVQEKELIKTLISLAPDHEDRYIKTQLVIQYYGTRSKNN